MTGIEHRMRSADDALAMLTAGNGAQREIARIIERTLALATASADPDATVVSTGDRAFEANDCEGLTDRGLDGLGRYAAAIGGVDVIETLVSHLEAARARLISEAYASAHQEIVDPERSPSDVLALPGGRTTEMLSREQIVGIDLATVLHVGVGVAKAKVAEAVLLARHLPRTLARLESGELTGWQVRRIQQAAAPLTPEQAEELDERVCGRAFTGQHHGPGQHRAKTTTVTRRIDTALRHLQLPTAADQRRKAGFAERRVRFGLTGEDGMTGLFGVLPAVSARAIDTLLDDLARTAPDVDERTHEQRRADAFVTLFTGPCALSPALQTSLDLDPASWDEAGHHVVVDESQNREAQAVWETIRLLAASIGLTFPDPGKARLLVDVPLDVVLGDHAGPPPDDGDPPPQGPAPHTGRPPLLDGAGKPAAVRRRRSLSDARVCQRRDRRRARRERHRVGDSWIRTHRHGADRPHSVVPESSPRGAMLRRVGSIPESLARRLLRYADLQRVVTDPLTRQPLEVGRRVPSTTIRDAVIARDGRCRFPDCTRPAATADLDHIQPYRNDTPAGTPSQTAPWNLHCLCREHHRAKHQLHWTPVMQDDGSVRWRNDLLQIVAYA